LLNSAVSEANSESILGLGDWVDEFCIIII